MSTSNTPGKTAMAPTARTYAAVLAASLSPSPSTKVTKKARIETAVTGTVAFATAGSPLKDGAQKRTEQAAQPAESQIVMDLTNSDDEAGPVKTAPVPKAVAKARTISAMLMSAARGAGTRTVAPTAKAAKTAAPAAKSAAPAAKSAAPAPAPAAKSAAPAAETSATPPAKPATVKESLAAAAGGPGSSIPATPPIVDVDNESDMDDVEASEDDGNDKVADMGTKRGRNACGHGAIDWNNESVRIAKFVNIKNTSRWNGIGHNFVRTPECTFLCLACMKHPGAKASVWTKGGNKVMNMTLFNKHLLSKNHLDVIGAAKNHTKMSNIVEKQKVKLNPTLCSLIRSAYACGKDAMPLTHYVKMVKLQAANCADCKHDCKAHTCRKCDASKACGSGITISGPYHTAEKASEMLACLSEAISEEQLKNIRASPVISMMIDESTDRTVSHNLAVYITYVAPDDSIKTEFLQLEAMNNGATAVNIYDRLKEVFTESKIDWSKLVAFTSDGANVMVGKHCGVATRIKTDWPCVLTSHCAAHRLALACADFFKEFPALVKVDNMLSKIYNYAKTSTVRTAALNDMYKERKAKAYKILKPHTVRWLSRSECVRRIKITYPILLAFFNERKKDKKDVAAAEIYEWLRQVDNLLLITCIDGVLAATAELSKWFQQSDLALVDVHQYLELGLRHLINAYTYHKEGETSNAPPSFTAPIQALIKDLAAKDGVFHGHQMVLTTPPTTIAPATTTTATTTAESDSDNDGSDTNTDTTAESGSDDDDTAPTAPSWAAFPQTLFRSKLALSSMVKKLVENIKMRFPADVSVAAKFGVLGPRALAADSGVPKYGEEEVAALAQHFKPVLGDDCLLAVDQWVMARARLIAVAKEQKKSGDVMKARPFYERLLSWLSGMGRELTVLVQIMLVLQPSTAEVERGFSAMNDIKTPGRASMKLGTLDVLMRVRLVGPPIAYQQRPVAGVSLAPYAEFDATLLGPAVQKFAAKLGRVPQRSSHNARPSRVKHRVCEIDVKALLKEAEEEAVQNVDVSC
ncbi:hypothetical protein CHLRE_16g672700v5 [Chlamydomonas reinhardtii]|uniref:Uncharacterized protein n=1 Tax=Chlamydomonas reinhardtii TaxID=3055 RepID=A0A2K3CVL7_CHLRE|nr:uncharacterized protein CHLRE_16g672700v5 [Chlamydomonas reinhardtii]PNW72327.1 hypothetical protein CHLRE_16g672700v5 [Chlamydomonas reinhardtii]